MISLEPEDVMAEIRAHVRARDKHLDGIQLLLEKYPGKWWSEGGVFNPSTSIDGENAPFEYISFEMTQLVWANPRWRVTTRRPRAQQLVAEAMHWGLNRWTVDSDLKTTLEDLAVDYSFSWAVAHVSPQPTPETYEAEDPILWPQLSRISPYDFGQDHRAPTTRRARIQWHRYRIDKDDLLERAKRDRERPRSQREGWNIAAIRELQESSFAESFISNNKARPFGSGLETGGIDEPDREQVEVLEVYFPTVKLPGKPGPEDGFNGTIATYGVSGPSSTPVVLRPPRPFFGPRWGPYTVIGCYIVPDSPWPLSVLAATAGQIEQANRISAAVDAQVAAYKRLGISSDRTLAQLIKDAPNDTVHTSQAINLESIFREFEIGGTTAANVAAEQRVIARRDRVMGFSENQRGTTTGDTATDVTYANEAAQGRQGYVRNRYQDGIRRAGKTVAWYLYYTDETIIPLGADALEALGLQPEDEAFFVGGSFDEGTGTTFDDLGLEIEPMSMERPSEGQLSRQGQLLTELMTTVVPALPQLAAMGGDARGILDALGDSFGFPKLSKLFPGIQSVDLASMQPMEVGARQGRDVGIRGLLKNFQPKGGGAGAFQGTSGPGQPSGQASPADFASVG